MKACFTYQIVTEESMGEAAEHGWLLPGMWYFALEDSEGHHANVLEDAIKGDFDLDDLGEVVNFASSLGVSLQEDGSFSTVDDHKNIETGDYCSYMLHVEGVTPATYARIGRLIEGY